MNREIFTGEDKVYFDEVFSAIRLEDADAVEVWLSNFDEANEAGKDYVVYLLIKDGKVIDCKMKSSL